MKFYEVHDPYYALIKAENKEIARDEYVASVADDEDGKLIEKLEEVPSDYAIARYSRALTEDREQVPLKEILEHVRNDVNMVLIFDGALV